MNMNIISIDMKGESGLAKCLMVVEVRDRKQLMRLQNKLKSIARIYDIERA